MAQSANSGILAIAIAWLACGRDGLETSPPTEVPYAHPRQATLSPGSEHYDDYEGVSGRNRCALDGDCLVSGCVGSTCAAESIDMADGSFCRELTAAQASALSFSRCGCLRGDCRWYFENDYDRACTTDADCQGLGPPPETTHEKVVWRCRDGRCQL